MVMAYDEEPDLGPVPEWVGKPIARKNDAKPPVEYPAPRPRKAVEQVEQPASEDVCDACGKEPRRGKLYWARAEWPVDRLCSDCYGRLLAQYAPAEYAANRICGYCGQADVDTFAVPGSAAKLRFCVPDFGRLVEPLRRQGVL